MFKLADKRGNLALKKDGTPFVYSSRDLARTAKGILEGQKVEGGHVTPVYRVVEV